MSGEPNGGGGGGASSSSPPLVRFVADVFGVSLEALRDGSEAVRLNGLKVVMALTSKVGIQVIHACQNSKSVYFISCHFFV